MKKEYESPKAEKMEFNYSEAVVASGSGCEGVGEPHGAYLHGQREGGVGAATVMVAGVKGHVEAVGEWVAEWVAEGAAGVGAAVAE